MRLNLAQVLISDADLMLLDEPTNHLDLDAILWTAVAGAAPRRLDADFPRSRFPGRHRVGDPHIEHGRLKRYAGDYSDFERQRAEQPSLQQKLHDKQQAQVAHMQKFIDRFRAKATKAKAAQSRIKALEKLERIALAHVDSGFESNKTPLKLPNPMVLLENAARGYADTTILSAVSMSLRRSPGSSVGPQRRRQVHADPHPDGRIAGALRPRSAGPGPEGRLLPPAGDWLAADESPYQPLHRQHPNWSEQQLRTNWDASASTATMCSTRWAAFPAAKKRAWAWR